MILNHSLISAQDFLIQEKADIVDSPDEFDSFIDNQSRHENLTAERNKIGRYRTGQDNEDIDYVNSLNIVKKGFAATKFNFSNMKTRKV